MQRACVGAIAAMACAFASAASAQDYPSRPIHVVIGFAAGSGADILTRFYANKLAEVSGQSTVVENRPGAVGIIAATVVAKAKPDGYTVLFSGNTIMAGGRHLVKDFPFDPDKDLVPAAAFLETPFVLAVSAKSGANSVAELVTLLKSKTRNKSAYTNPTGLLSTELFKMKTGIESESVSYKTTADAIPDLADGTLDFMILDGTLRRGGFQPHPCTRGDHQSADHGTARRSDHAGGRHSGLPLQPMVGSLRARRHASGNRSQN
jgi:tripartite-type tricarboxylate transporter receptor subunit TctC